ncbi:hypothetical protein [uncultured Lactobacillus sp.]|uniref:hypothetical protein n=1 Tax=uncultured Lactobacillus sp. TaxID=153152 RepID=UPI0025828AF2|nr:hypothetical protein [uncultured Lactobacillus sp.]
MLGTGLMMGINARSVKAKNGVDEVEIVLDDANNQLLSNEGNVEDPTNGGKDLSLNDLNPSGNETDPVEDTSDNDGTINDDTNPSDEDVKSDTTLDEDSSVVGDMSDTENPSNNASIAAKSTLSDAALQTALKEYAEIICLKKAK